MSRSGGQGSSGSGSGGPGAATANYSRRVPALTKLAGNPIFTQASNPLGTMQWPWLVNVVAETGSTGSFGETYRIYYSTDHEGATAAVGLLTANSRTGPWTARGQVYQDSTSGNQTETPSVVYNADEGLWFLYYHQVNPAGANFGEVTMLATSPNGVDTWTRVGIIMDISVALGGDFPAGGGIGYVRPFRVGRDWYAHGLLAGGDFARFGLWRSTDGRVWRLDPRPLANGAEYVGGSNRIEWNSGTVFQYNGEPWWVGLVGNFTSGGETRQTYYATAPVSRDFRQVRATPVPLFSSLQAWETSPADNRSGGSMIVDTDGKLVLAYSGAADKFGIAVSA